MARVMTSDNLAVFCSFNESLGVYFLQKGIYFLIFYSLYFVVKVRSLPVLKVYAVTVIRKITVNSF